MAVAMPSGGSGGGVAFGESLSGGGSGGQGCAGQAGSDGTSADQEYGPGSGGGGGGAGGGHGGSGGGYSAGRGGAGGGAGGGALADGQQGTSPGTYSTAGGGGGGGGFNGSITADILVAGTKIVGGMGGAGGDAYRAGQTGGSQGYFRAAAILSEGGFNPTSGGGGSEGGGFDPGVAGGGGGGGGGGGYGAVLTQGTLTIRSDASVTGGNGGRGGSGYEGNGGDGGAGGIGLFARYPATIDNAGTIAGGNGGAGGAAFEAYRAGGSGAGGIGLVGAGLTITNSGSIHGGLGADGDQALSIYFTGGDNVLTLQPGGSLAGDILLNGQLTFKQTSDATLDRSILNTAPGLGTMVGSVVKNGPGGLTFAAANSFSGGTSVLGGRLTLDHATEGVIDAAGSGGIVLGNGTLKTAVTGTLDNALTVSPGAAATLAATAGTTVTLRGPLALGASSTTTFGSLADTGSVIFAQSPAAYRQTVSATGGPQVTVDPTAQLVLAGGTLLAAAQNKALGDVTEAAKSITINAGTLDFNGNNATINTLLGAGGTVTNAAGATTTLKAADYKGTIAGGTTLLIMGGTVALAGSNTYTGGTLLKSGTLSIGSSTALGSNPLQMSAGTTLAFAADGLTLNNPIELKTTRDPAIDTGTNNATVAGIISGPGALTKQGLGSLTLSAPNTYSGATTVEAGRLVVDGSIGNSTTTLKDGSSLGGIGTLGPLIAEAGSVVAPGPAGGYGSLTISGPMTFAPGSTFQVKIDPAGNTDRLVVTDVATLNGATLSVREAPGSYTNILSPYRILTADGGVDGTFGSVVAASALPFVDPTVVYGPKTVTLAFVRNDTPLPSVALTPNQAGAAGAIQSGATPAPPTNNAVTPDGRPRRPRGSPSPVPNPGPDVLYNAVLGQTPAGAQQAFRAVAGTLYAGQTASTIQASRYVSVNVLDRLFSIAGSGLDARQLLDQLAPNALPTFVNCFAPLPAAEKLVPQNLTLWGDGFGSFGRTSGNADAAGLDHALGGFILGADAPLHGFSAPYRVGIAGGYTNDSFSSRGEGGSGTAESYFGTLYGSARYGNVDVRLGTSVAAIQTTADRTVAFPGFFEKEHGRYWGDVVQGFGEVGYRFATSRYVVEPVLDAAVVHIHQDGFRESGGAAALIGYAQDVDTASTTLGVRAEAALVSGLPLIARTFLGWRHGYGNINPAATFAFASGSTPFSSTGAPIDRDALAAEAGLDWRTSSRLTLGASYVGQVGARNMDNAVRGRVEYKF